MFEIISGTAKAATSLWDRYHRAKAIASDAIAFRRLLYLECRRNLGILDSLNLDTEFTGSSVAAIGLMLETAVLEQVLAQGVVPTRVFASLGDPSETQRGLFAPDRTAREAAMALYVSISSLQKLAPLVSDELPFKTLNFTTRLKHIQSNLLPRCEGVERGRRCGVTGDCAPPSAYCSAFLFHAQTTKVKTSSSGSNRARHPRIWIGGPAIRNFMESNETTNAVTYPPKCWLHFNVWGSTPHADRISD